MQLGQASEALEYYEKALKHSDNEFTAPKFLYKAGVTALDLGEKDKALKYFQQIKDDYASSEEARTVDAFIGMAKSTN